MDISALLIQVSLIITGNCFKSCFHPWFPHPNKRPWRNYQPTASDGDSFHSSHDYILLPNFQFRTLAIIIYHKNVLPYLEVQSAFKLFNDPHKIFPFSKSIIERCFQYSCSYNWRVKNKDSIKRNVRSWRFEETAWKVFRDLRILEYLLSTVYNLTKSLFNNCLNIYFFFF